MDPHPPKLDPTYFGCEKNEKLMTLMPAGVPKERKPAPYEVLKTIKGSCTSEMPCATNRCSCSSRKLSCSIVCSCGGDGSGCCNDQTKADQEREEGDDNTTDSDEEEECQWTELHIHIDAISEIQLCYILLLFMYSKIYCFKNLSLNIQLRISLWILPTFLPCSLFGVMFFVFKVFSKGYDLELLVEWPKIITFTF